MKLKDLFEEQRVISGDVLVPHDTPKLAFGGTVVMGMFDCSNTRIKSLIGSPTKVHGAFYCYNTKIPSLEGAPSYVGGNFDCDDTKIISLHNIHKQVKYIGGIFRLSSTIKSHVLGVMFIKGLQRIVFGLSGGTLQRQAEVIINSHLVGAHDPHEVQEELIDAGLSEYAKI